MITEYTCTQQNGQNSKNDKSMRNTSGPDTLCTQVFNVNCELVCLYHISLNLCFGCLKEPSH